MKYSTRLALFGFIFFLVFTYSAALAEYATTEIENGRYVMVMISGSGGNSARTNITNKTPVVVLDSVLGIVWRCQNIQDEKPLWIKNDLGKNADKSLSAKKYMIKILEWPGTESRIPAAVLDIEEGKVWTCPNILDESAVWIPKDLAKDIKDEGYKYR